MNDTMKKLESELFSIGKSDLVKSVAFGLLSVLLLFAGQVITMLKPAIDAMKVGTVPVLPSPHDYQVAALIAIGTGLGTLQTFLVHKFLSDADGTPRYIPFLASIGKLTDVAKQTVIDGKAVMADVAKKDMLAAMSDSAKVVADVQNAAAVAKEATVEGGAA